MVGAVEQEPGPAGDGAEPADHQPVLVDGIVIQHIVFFKVNRMITDYSFLASFTFLKCQHFILSFQFWYDFVTHIKNHSIFG